MLFMHIYFTGQAPWEARGIRGVKEVQSEGHLPVRDGLGVLRVFPEKEEMCSISTCESEDLRVGKSACGVAPETSGPRVPSHVLAEPWKRSRLVYPGNRARAERRGALQVRGEAQITLS